jgi:hypothetical protein
VQALPRYKGLKKIKGLFSGDGSHTSGGQIKRMKRLQNCGLVPYEIIPILSLPVNFPESATFLYDDAPRWVTSKINSLIHTAFTALRQAAIDRRQSKKISINAGAFLGKWVADPGWSPDAVPIIYDSFPLWGHDCVDVSERSVPIKYGARSRKAKIKGNLWPT